MRKIVIALGGNALGSTLPEQASAVKVTAKTIVDLIEDGNQVVIVHGNGPQVGIINNAMMALMREDPAQGSTPLSVCGAMSQAYIGYDLQNALREELLDRGIRNKPGSHHGHPGGGGSEGSRPLKPPPSPSGNSSAGRRQSASPDGRDSSTRRTPAAATAGMWHRPGPGTSSSWAPSGQLSDDGHIVICCGRRGDPRIPHGAQPPQGRCGGHRQGLRR